MKKLLAAAATITVGISTAQAAQVRYFLSHTAGLSNPANTESSASPAPTVHAAVNGGDPVVGAGSFRFYVWAMLPATPAADLLGFNLAFRAVNATIQSTNIWQNTNGFVDPDTGEFVEMYRRWEDGGFPGHQNWGDAATANPTPTVAVLTDGVTNSAAVGDDQRRSINFGDVNPQHAVLVGWIEVTSGFEEGYIHIVNEGSGFLQIDPNNRVYLGLDDQTGAPAEVAGQPYDNSSPEAIVNVVPEPTSLALLTFVTAALLLRHSRMN